ncbi:hypothetical protein JTE90_006568 [Oedothorax gibbosus]|uniref:Uncharacterized protein n=1 Tax=Oedothorax gibbosus TaxID=931172 RepID=A0AAV6VKS3_9ARAC|nr:hypothetical protein JTE90_006568 [Oedothorax gibbosus]
MNVLIISTFLVLCVSIAITESRYPYEDSYRPGDIVPTYTKDRRLIRDRDGGRYPIGRVPGTRGGYPGNRGGYPGNRGYPVPGISGIGLNRDGPYVDYHPSDYDRRRRRNHLPPRGLGGHNKRNYDNYDYDYGGYRRQSRVRGPGLYSNDDYGYGDYLN